MIFDLIDEAKTRLNVKMSTILHKNKSNTKFSKIWPHDFHKIAKEVSFKLNDIIEHKIKLINFNTDDNDGTVDLELEVYVKEMTIKRKLTLNGFISRQKIEDLLWKSEMLPNNFKKTINNELNKFINEPNIFFILENSKLKEMGYIVEFEVIQFEFNFEEEILEIGFHLFIKDLDINIEGFIKKWNSEELFK